MAFEMMNMRNEYGLEMPGNNNHMVLSSFYGRTNPSAQFYSQRPPMSMNEQAEVELELRCRGNMIFDQQRKIQQLEDELKLAHSQIDALSSQLQAYEQERSKEKKKPQSRYWTAEEHQRFLEALDKYGSKDVKAISQHVATRNATQVRTHAQKYFLRVNREAQKKEGTLPEGEGDSSEGDEDGDEDSHIGMSISHITNHPISPAVSQPPSRSESPEAPPTTLEVSPSITTRRPRATSLLHAPRAPANAQQTSGLSHSTSMINNPNFLHPSSAGTATPSTTTIAPASSNRMPSNWTMNDHEQFVQGLVQVQQGDKKEDDEAACRLIHEQFLPQRSLEEVVSYYSVIMKRVNRKSPYAAFKTPNVHLNSPKRRRVYSRPEPLVCPPGVNQSPLNLSPLNPNSAPPQPYNIRALQALQAGYYANQPNSSLQMSIHQLPQNVNNPVRVPFDFSNSSTMNDDILLSELTINNVAINPMSIQSPSGLSFDSTPINMGGHNLNSALSGGQSNNPGMFNMPFSFDTLMSMTPQQGSGAPHSPGTVSSPSDSSNLNSSGGAL